MTKEIADKERLLRVAVALTQIYHHAQAGDVELVAGLANSATAELSKIIGPINTWAADRSGRGWSVGPLGVRMAFVKKRLEAERLVAAFNATKILRDTLVAIAGRASSGDRDQAAAALRTYDATLLAIR